MLKLKLLILFILTINVKCQNNCDRNNGPSGVIECVKLTPYYSEYQWATCLTNAYIREKTKGVFKCRDSSATYCWYQCMVEIHERDQGSVYNDCKCDPDSVQNVTKPPIDDSCFSPDGNDCSWYRNCVEKRYSCPNDNYAIEYAQKFCNLYSQNYNYFSDQAKLWINGVKKCLQVSLAPTLRPWISMSCKELKKFAFDSHAPCYLKPDTMAPSICDLKCLDWYRIFWTIKGSFSSWSGAIETLKGMIKVSMGCKIKAGLCAAGSIVGSPFYLPILTYQFGFRPKQKSLSYHLEKNFDFTSIENSFYESISKQMKWNTKELDWFTFADEENSNETEIKVNMWLLSKNELNQTIMANQSNVLNKANENLIDSYMNGKLRFSLKVNNIDYSNKEMIACEDSLCQTKSIEYIAPPQLNSASNSFEMHSKIAILLFLLQLILIII